jgi:hypothetical protein
MAKVIAITDAVKNLAEDDSTFGDEFAKSFDSEPWNARLA